MDKLTENFPQKPVFTACFLMKRIRIETFCERTEKLHRINAEKSG